jgi:hypothetical protein
MPEVSPEVEIRVLESIKGLEAPARQGLAEFVLRKGLAAGSTTPLVLAQVHRSLDGPVSDGLMEDILRAPAWSQWSAVPETHHSVFTPLAALCPPAKRPALRDALTRVEPSHIMPILQFLDILERLEKVSSHE